MPNKFPRLFFTGPRINLAKLPKSHRGHDGNGVASGRGGGGRQAAAPNAHQSPIWTSADVEGDRELMTALTLEEKVRA